MDDLRNSSNEINKIVSDITSLSSQTNILALNASVEAVRAGEAGKSFTVVAEEVRNLSQQSSAAASNTEKIIKNNINLTHQAAENSNMVDGALQKISNDVKKVSQLLREITIASDEQSSGIKQVNIAMSEMERVTQSTAAVSEESAAAAGDLETQSHTLEDVIKEITILVEGHL
jgi:methyl-accepting chemotaxis protein